MGLNTMYFFICKTKQDTGRLKYLFKAKQLSCIVLVFGNLSTGWAIMRYASGSGKVSKGQQRLCRWGHTALRSNQDWQQHVMSCLALIEQMKPTSEGCVSIEWSVFSPFPSSCLWDTWPRHTENRTHYVLVLENALYFHSLGMNWKTDNWALKEKVLFTSSITMRMGAGNGWSSATIPVTPCTLILLCVFTGVCLPTSGQGQCGRLWYGGWITQGKQRGCIANITRGTTPWSQMTESAFNHQWAWLLILILYFLKSTEGSCPV